MMTLLAQAVQPAFDPISTQSLLGSALGAALLFLLQRFRILPAPAPAPAPVPPPVPVQPVPGPSPLGPLDGLLAQLRAMLDEFLSRLRIQTQQLQQGVPPTAVQSQAPQAGASVHRVPVQAELHIAPQDAARLGGA